MVDKTPFASKEEMIKEASRIWWNDLTTKDWLEAFAAHPRIGDKDALRKKFQHGKSWESGEQAGAENAKEKTLDDLKNANGSYEKRYGFIFLVCATGKSASEMLNILRSRMSNNRDVELVVAAGEQDKITKLRIDKLMKEENMNKKLFRCKKIRAGYL